MRNFTVVYTLRDVNGIPQEGTFVAPSYELAVVWTQAMRYAYGTAFVCNAVCG